MTNTDILAIALKQSAIDSNCLPEDFLSDKNAVVLSAENMAARKYLELPFYCDLTSYGNNVVASVNAKIAGAVELYLSRYSAEHCFETPNLYVLNAELERNGMRVCFMAEYFLPDANELKPLALPEGIRIKTLQQNNFTELYVPQWSNALCEKRKHLDVLALGAYDRNTLIGLAGCSADCDSMRQIGVDVLPAYRKNGIAAALVSRLGHTILQDNLVPFYCAAWSNVKSARTAIKSGFRPAWVQVTAKSTQEINTMNGQEHNR